MINDEKRLRNRNFVNWDFVAEANDPKAFDLMSTVERMLNEPMQFTPTSNKANQKNECAECKYKRAVEEVLNVLSLCNIVKKTEPEKPQAEKGYKIKVE